MVARRKIPELSDDEISIVDVGPIHEFQFRAPPGSIVVLRGKNGSGKSTILDAVDALTSGNGRVVGRDGTTSGSVRGFGVRITVGRGGANRRSGELTVENIEDRIQIDQLVDPGLKDPVAADGRRIRALVQLSGVQPSLSLFEGLLPEGRLVALVPEEAAQADDLVDMAARVKRALESHARKAEQAVDGLRRDKEAKLATCEGIDLSAPHDRHELQRAAEEATIAWTQLREKRAAGVEALAKRAEDKARLDALRAERAGRKSLSELTLEAEEAAATWRSAHDRVADLREQLRQAESDEALAALAMNSANSILESERRESATMTALESAVEGALPPCPSSEEVAQAHARVMQTRAAVETGVRVRDALCRVAEAEAIGVKIDDAEEAAVELRDAARGTEDVLSRIVAGMGGRFKVNADLRLIVPGTERGEEFFSELSHGERWKLAIDVAVEAFARTGRPGLLALEQSAWEGLDGRARAMLAARIAETDLALITAEADHSAEPSDEIAAEVFAAEFNPQTASVASHLEEVRSA